MEVYDPYFRELETISAHPRWDTMAGNSQRLRGNPSDEELDDAQRASTSLPKRDGECAKLPRLCPSARCYASDIPKLPNGGRGTLRHEPSSRGKDGGLGSVTTVEHGVRICHK